MPHPGHPEAIAIPEDQLDGALVAALPQLLAYALSFVIIARTWMSHRCGFAGIHRFSVNLARLNLVLLFFIAMLPGALVFLLCLPIIRLRQSATSFHFPLECLRARELGIVEHG